MERRVNVKVEPRSSLNVYVRPFIHGIAFILFTPLKFALRKKHATVEIHLKTPVDSQTKSWYTLFFFPLSSQIKKTLNQKQDNKGKSIGRTSSVVRIVRKGKKFARTLRAFSSIA